MAQGALEDNNMIQTSNIVQEIIRLLRTLRKSNPVLSVMTETEEYRTIMLNGEKQLKLYAFLFFSGDCVSIVLSVNEPTLCRKTLNKHSGISGFEKKYNDRITLSEIAGFTDAKIAIKARERIPRWLKDAEAGGTFCLSVLTLLPLQACFIASGCTFANVLIIFVVLFHQPLLACEFSSSSGLFGSCVPSVRQTY